MHETPLTRCARKGNVRANPTRLAAIALAVFSCQGRPAVADQIWQGANDNQWTTSGNWSGNAIPGSTDFVLYNNLSTANLSNWLSQAFSIKGIQVSNVPGPVSIDSGNSLTLGASGINLSNATQPLAVSAPVTLGANQIWGVTNNQALVVLGPISGGSGIYKDGFGALYLSGANSFTGGFTNNGGPVWINNSAALGTGNKQVWVANNNVGAGLHLNGTNGNITLASGLSFTLSQQNGAIFNEAGNNTIGGNINVFSGGGYAYIVVNAGTLTLNGTITLGTTPRSITLGGAGNGTVNGAINGTSFPFRKVDAGAWTLGNNNGYSGYTTVEGGTLFLKPTAKINNTTNITVFANATLDVSAVTNATFGSNVFVLTANQVLAGSGTITGNVATAANASIQPGSLNVAQSAGGTGAAGTLAFADSLTLGSAVTNYFELNTATAVGSGVNDLITVGGNIDPQNARIFVTALGAFTPGIPYRLFNYAGAKLSSFDPVVLTDTHSTFSLDESAANQVNVTVSPGPILLWSGTTTSGTWDLNNSANWNNNTLSFLNFDPVTFDDTAVTNAVTLAGTLKPASVLFANSGSTYTLQGSGKITGPTGLTKMGSGLLIITTSGSDYTGPVTVNDGTLSVGSVALNGVASTLGAGTNIILDGGTFRFTGPRPAASSFNGYWTLGPAGGSVLSTNGTFFIPNTISGPGSLIKTGSVQIILGDIVAGVLTNAINTYTGDTFITQGELQIRNARALGYGKAMVSAGADLAVGGGANYGTITNSIDLHGGDGNNGAGTLQVNDAGSAANYGGVISLLADSSVGTVNNGNAVTFAISGPIIGAGGLKKLGTNTVTLTSPNNTYSGPTTIAAGTLALGTSASIGASSGISIAPGATFNVSAISAYSLGGAQSFSSSGAATAAIIRGASGGSVNFGSRPITLVYDGSHPALTISQGTLSLNGNAFTVNGAALAPGTYTLIQQASGAILSSGSYSVAGTAIAPGRTGSISVAGTSVSLIVKAVPSFANLTADQSISYGTASVILSGTLSATGSVYPANGEIITISINGNSQTTTINDSTGDFSISFNPSTLPCSAVPYPVTYSYSGNATLSSASDASKTLTVMARPLDITANDTTKACGQTLSFAGTEFTTGAGQLVNGDSVASVTLTSQGAGGGASAGLYDIVPNGATGIGLSNYLLSYHNGQLTISDTTAPVLVYCVTNLTLGTTSSNCQAALPDLTGTNYILAVDDCSSSVTVTQNPPANTWMPLGTNEVVLSAFDASGNTTNCTNTVVVADSTPPVITLLGANPLTNDCHSAFIDPGATALDNCAGPVQVTTNGAVNTDASGIYTIEYVASDPAGNNETNARTVYVVDTTPPVITLNGTNPLLVDCHGAFNDPGATALDTCAGPVPVVTSGSVDINIAGSYTLTYAADDENGNTNIVTRAVIVQDTAPPSVVYSFTNLTLSASGTNCQALLPDLTGTNYILALDACSSSVTVTQNPAAGTWLSLGTNDVVLTALDFAGNAVSSTNRVVVVDTAPPEITLLGGNPLTNECHSPFTDPGATAVDLCAGAVDVSTHTTVNTSAIGIYTIDYVATDPSGNTATNSRTVHVRDTTPPVIACPDNITVATGNIAGTRLNFSVTATDGCDPAPTVFTIPASGSVFPPGTNVVTCYAYDTTGNSNTCSFLVTLIPFDAFAARVVHGPLVANGQFEVHFQGVPGYDYTVEATHNLQSPIWTKVVNLTAPAADQGFGIGVFQFTQSIGTATSRFYRTVFPPY